MIHTKKYIFLFLALSLAMVKASAQDVLNEVIRTSDRIINDTTKNLDERKIAMFKWDAMTYQRGKILPAFLMFDKKANPDSINQRIKFLNEQAYAMSVYITLFQKRMAEAKEKEQPMVARIFKQATYDHKLFHDSDTETTMAYNQRLDYPIQFCIDCNWVQTLAFIRKIDWSKF